MNEKALRILEYDKIIRQLSAHASSEMGKQLCRDLQPMTNLMEIETAQEQTKDALTRVYQYGSLSFAGLTNITASLKRLEIQASLSAKELLDIARILEITNNARQYSDRDGDDQGYDSLDGMFLELVPMTPLLLDIRRCILAEDEISDDASAALKQVRRTIRQTNQKVHQQLASIVNSSSNKSMLQDSLITMRNGRYCIPVKAEYRSSFPGMIHDQSATGSTLFIEPMSVVQLNNTLKELEIQEQAEIERVLAALSEQVAAVAEDIAYNVKILAKLDFIFAKAKFAKSYDGSEPEFNTDGIINIKQGRHPLLDKKKVVPINVSLGDTFDMLIITGPNTGGKTVSLKTVGLFSLMGQSGLHIPAFQGSKLTVFDNVYADIGDEQSIEQNLSTFSSHMTNIISILNEATDQSLVLLDELCGGTDPVEGAALAISILTDLLNRGIHTMATTHYSELKMFALSTEGIENACCEFNVETLRPTYRLLIGIPGKSNAFAISKKLGLPDFIIEDAKQRIDSQDESFEDVISSLEASRVTIEKEQAEIAQYKAEIEQLKKKLESKQERLEEQKERILQKAREEAQNVLQEAKDFADETIRIINKQTSGGNISRALEKERAKLRGKLDDVNTKLNKQTESKPKKALKPKELKIGDAVKVLSMNLKGTVSTLPNAKGDFFVQMGILRSQVNIKDVEKIEEQTITGPGTSMQKSSTSKIKMNKSSYVSPEVNLIGMTVDEALSVLDKYLDDAYLAHIPQVRVVHGRGTGALRNGVHNHLRRLKYVKSFRLGSFGEGDTGVTIVEFK